MPREIPQIRPGDLVRMRKQHPCGGDEWRVTRVGADIGIQCSTCGRRVMLDRLVYEQRVKVVVEQGPEADAPAPPLAFDDAGATQDGRSP
jgi:hypothetical protein